MCEETCCSEPPLLEECQRLAMQPLREACCGRLRGLARLSHAWVALEEGLEAAVAELLRIVRATEVSCSGAGCDPFAQAAQVAMASELSPIFQFGWLDLADLGEFSVQVGLFFAPEQRCRRGVWRCCKWRSPGCRLGTPWPLRLGT